jgi:hypothetical protein
MTETIGARVPASHCPDCGHVLDGAYDPKEGAVPPKEGGNQAVPPKEGGNQAVPPKEGGNQAVPPKEGDFAVCIECGCPMVYRADQTLRPLLAPEWAKLKEEERTQIEAMRAAVDARRREQGKAGKSN